MHWILLALAFSLAQPIPITPVIPVTPPPPTPSAPAIVAPADDPRLARCAAPTLPNWRPHVVTNGDTLPALLAGVEDVTAADIALLNCLDDPHALPYGGVIWLPPGAISPPEATPEAEATAAPDARVVSFEADSSEANNLEGVELTWEAEGERVYLLPCQLGDCTDAPQPVAAQGSHTIPYFPYAGDYTFRLVATANDAETGDFADLTVTVTCAYNWLIGVTPLADGRYLCPFEPPRPLYAVYQPFEHGAMIWFSDTQQIYVFSEDNRFQVFEDTWAEGQPDPSEDAPEGLHTPVRGFGRIWAQLGGTESSLGWGTAPEAGYDALTQPAGQVSYTTFITFPGGEAAALTEVPGQAEGYWVPNG